MIKHTEVMKLALEALTKNSDRVTEIRAKDQAITALREALTSVPDWAREAKEQPAQQKEPVAWLADVRKVRDALDPEDWCGDERMIDVLDRALAQRPCCKNMAAGTSCLADPRTNCPMLAAPQPAPATELREQEPVAYAVYHRMGGGKSLHWPEQHSPDGDANEYQLLPLYTSPPAQQEPVDFASLLREAEEIVREKPTWKRFIDGTPLANDIAVWMTVFAQDAARRASPPAQPSKPLTDEEILVANYPDGEENGPTIAAPNFELICFARQIEAKLQEKNSD